MLRVHARGDAIARMMPRPLMRYARMRRGDDADAIYAAATIIDTLSLDA